MQKIVWISSTSPLSLNKISDPKHWKACHDGFGKKAPVGATKGELEALSHLITWYCHGSSSADYPNRLLWSYALHTDLDLSELAFNALAINHNDTIAFDWLSLVRRRSFISLLIFKLEQINSLSLSALAESIGNRSIGAENEEEAKLAVKLLSLAKPNAQDVNWLPILSAKVRQLRVLMICTTGEDFMPKDLRIHLLHQILIHETPKRAILAEQALAGLLHSHRNYLYRYRDVKSANVMLAQLPSHIPEKKDALYSIVLQWKAKQFKDNLADPLEEVRVMAEITLLAMLPGEIQPFLELSCFSFDCNQFDTSGNLINYSLNRAHIHSRLFPMSAKNAHFYHQYSDTELSKKVILFIKKMWSEAELPILSPKLKKREWGEQIIIDMLDHFPFNVRRFLATHSVFCDSYFNHFLKPGLPLHSIDAINSVCWDTFLERASPNQISEASSYLTRIFKLNSTFKDSFQDKFQISKN